MDIKNSLVVAKGDVGGAEWSGRLGLGDINKLLYIV